MAEIVGTRDPHVEIVAFPVVCRVQRGEQAARGQHVEAIVAAAHIAFAEDDRRLLPTRAFVGRVQKLTR